MPRLLLFAPCDKLIVDELGNPTLVCVIENINVEVKKDTPIPDDVFSPKEWDVVTLWYSEPGDASKKFKQRFQFELPDGKAVMKSEIEFQMKENDRHRNNIHITGFPVGKPGRCLARVWLDAIGVPPSTEPVGEFPVHVAHKPA